MVALILESMIDNQNIAWSFRYREPLQSQLQSNPSCSIEERANLTAVRSQQSAVLLCAHHCCSLTVQQSSPNQQLTQLSHGWGRRGIQDNWPKGLGSDVRRMKQNEGQLQRLQYARPSRRACGVTMHGDDQDEPTKWALGVW